MVFLCHRLAITVDKQGINTFKWKNHVSNVISILCRMKSLMKREKFFKSFMKCLHIGQGHYISAIDVNPRVWDHLEKVEKMTGLEMGLFGLPLGLFCSSFRCILMHFHAMLEISHLWLYHIDALPWVCEIYHECVKYGLVSTNYVMVSHLFDFFNSIQIGIYTYLST